MAARIRSLRNAIDPVNELSRNDLALGDVVSVTSIDGATTYNWTLQYVPEGSTATFSGSATAVSPGSFTVDRVGPYLVRLIVDVGLPTESTQYVRLRALTTKLGLTLVSAGERRDGTGIIPVDVDATGWADEQNNNLLALENAIAATIGTLGTLSYNKNIPEIADDSVSYKGWAPVACTLIAVRARMMTVNTAGNYSLTVINNGTGNTVIDSPPFNMNTLVAGVVQPVTLTATSTDLSFAALDGWTITLTSDNPGFNGTDVYIELVFNTATAGGPVVEDLATTLLVGNITGGTNIEVTNGDLIVGQPAPTSSGLDGFDLVLRGGLGDGAGVQGEVVVSGDLKITNGVVFDQIASSAWPDTGATEGAIFVSDGTGGLNLDEPYYRPASNGPPIALLGGGSGGGSPFVHKNVPQLPTNTFRYEGWVPIAAVVGGISVAMETVNTQGNYTAVFTNETTGNTMLIGASFDMNTLVAATVTDLTLTGTLSDLTFAAGDQWSVELTSDDLAFDGTGIYFSILFGTTGSIVISGAPDDDHQFEMTVFPNNTINTLFFAPYNLQLVEVLVYGQTTPTTAGVYTLAVEDIDNSNNLLGAATFDMTSLAAATLTTLTLTGTAGDLLLAKGTRIRLQLVSDNADLVASGVYAQLIYRSQ